MPTFSTQEHRSGWESSDTCSTIAGTHIRCVCHRECGRCVGDCAWFATGAPRTAHRARAACSLDWRQPVPRPPRLHQQLRRASLVADRQPLALWRCGIHHRALVVDRGTAPAVLRCSRTGPADPVRPPSGRYSRCGMEGRDGQSRSGGCADGRCPVVGADRASAACFAADRGRTQRVSRAGGHVLSRRRGGQESCRARNRIVRQGCGAVTIPGTSLLPLGARGVRGRWNLYGDGRDSCSAARVAQRGSMRSVIAVRSGRRSGGSHGFAGEAAGAARWTNCAHWPPNTARSRRRCDSCACRAGVAWRMATWHCSTCAMGKEALRASWREQARPALARCRPGNGREAMC